MSKQGGKGGAAGKAKKPAKPGADEKREDVLQAVILADSFQDRFRPFTLETPRVCWGCQFRNVRISADAETPAPSASFPW